MDWYTLKYISFTPLPLSSPLETARLTSLRPLEPVRLHIFIHEYGHSNIVSRFLMNFHAKDSENSKYEDPQTKKNMNRTLVFFECWARALISASMHVVTEKRHLCIPFDWIKESNGIPWKITNTTNKNFSKRKKALKEM